jgi:2'-5' RNA ligase
VNNQRLFFALWPEPKVCHELVGLVKQFEKPMGHPLLAQDLHITLVFLGEVKSAQISCIEQVAEVIDIPVFDLWIDRIGYWARPKIMWAAPKTVGPYLMKLVAVVNERLFKCGFKPEQRPYRPHVTLLRKTPPIIPVPRDCDINIHWPVDRFVLAASAKEKEGRRYRILQHWHLRHDMSDS